MKLKKGKGTETAKNESPRTLSGCIADIEKKYGRGIVQFLVGNGVTQKVDVIPTGSLALDKALVIGGLPRGRVVEVFGQEASGKTNLTLNVIAEAQKLGLKCAFVDAEHSLSPDMATGTGVKLEDLLFSQPDSGEQALDIVELLVKSGEFGLVVVDSVAALVPQKELDGEMSEQQVGLQARMLGKGLRKLGSVIAKTNTCVVFINQLRMKIGVMFGNPHDTPGGKALKFFSSVRLDVRAIGQIKEGEEVVGNNLKITVVKNKLAPPFRKAETQLIFGKGFSKASEAFNKAVELELIEKEGNTYCLGEEKIGVGKTATIKSMEDNPELMDKILKAIEKEENES